MGKALLGCVEEFKKAENVTSLVTTVNRKGNDFKNTSQSSMYLLVPRKESHWQEDMFCRSMGCFPRTDVGNTGLLPAVCIATTLDILGSFGKWLLT